MITARGLCELRMALAPDQVGFILDRLQLLAFQTTFNPATRKGELAINTSIFSQASLKKGLTAMKEVFGAGLCVSDLVALASEGEKLGDAVIPAGKVGLATVCSVTVNGVLLKAGVPVDSRFAGVLEIKGLKPRRFIAVINYAGTSIDPSEQYIRAGMAHVTDAARTGSGSVLANFREIPAAARSLVADTVAGLKEAGINGVYVLGNTGETVCQIAVGLNRVGMVLLGGLNPVAAAVEAGIEVDNISESGVIDYSRLARFSDL